MSELLEAICDLAAMPPDLVDVVAAALRRSDAACNSTFVHGAIQCLPQEWRDPVRIAIARAASSKPPFGWEALAVSIEAAAAARSAALERQQVELVWSGPPVVQSTFRRTDRVWIDLIDSAKEVVWLASFSVGNIERIQESLLRALARRVRLRMLFERSADCGGSIRYDGFQQFDPGILAKAELYAWPLSNRERDTAGNLPLMHAKAMVVDRRRMFVTSANLSGAAFDRNIEIGVVVDGGAQPSWLHDRFESLVLAGIIEKTG